MTSPQPTKGTFRRVARRPRYAKKTVERVCALIRQGLGLREIAMREGMPSVDTLGLWLTEKAEFRALHDRAREAQDQLFTDDVVMLADAVAESDATSLKLRIDARKWRIAEKEKRKAAGNGGPDQAALDAEVIARLEAGLPRAIRSGTRDAAHPAGGDGETAGPDSFGAESQPHSRNRE